MSMFVVLYFLLTFFQKSIIIVSIEQVAIASCSDGIAAEFHNNGSFEPLLWNSDIIAMCIFIGTSQSANEMCRVFAVKPRKALHPNNAEIS